MSSNTKERLLSDLEGLRHQLAEIEAYDSSNPVAAPSLVAIPTLEVDNIPLLGDAVPANREEAIIAHREAMAQLDAELRELDNAEQNEKTHAPSQNTADALAIDTAATEEPPIDTVNADASHNSVETAKLQDATYKNVTSASAQPLVAPALKDNAATVFATAKQSAESLLSSHLKAYAHPMATPTSSDENPFLPQHLRERLDKSKTSLLEEIARSSESLDASTALLRNFSGEKPHAIPASAAAPLDHKILVDTLVAKYLPLIEADLRQRLNTSLQQQLAAQQEKALEPSH